MNKQQILQSVRSGIRLRWLPPGFGESSLRVLYLGDTLLTDDEERLVIELEFEGLLREKYHNPKTRVTEYEAFSS